MPQRSAPPINSERFKKYDLMSIHRTNITSYNIVFFNSMCTSNDHFSYFKDMYKTLPLMYYSKLEKIYLVHPTLSVKSLDWIVFGRLNKLFSKRLEFINTQQLHSDLVSKYNRVSYSIKQLERTKFYKFVAKIIPNEIIQFEKLEISSASKPPKSTAPTAHDTKAVPSDSPTKAPKFTPFDYLKIPLEKYEMTDERIPKLLKLLVSVMNLKTKMLELQGIFRKSANCEEEEELIIQLINKNDKYLENVDDGYVLAGVIKKIFTNIVEPLFPYTVYEEIVKAEGIKPDQEVAFVKSLLKNLPELNYRVLLFICTFIKEKIIKREALNKMSNYNCAVVFAPCFMRPKVYEMSAIMESGKMVKVLLIIFTKFEEVFGKPSDRMEVFEKSAERAAKEEIGQKRASSESPKRTSDNNASMSLEERNSGRGALQVRASK